MDINQLRKELTKKTGEIKELREKINKINNISSELKAIGIEKIKEPWGYYIYRFYTPTLFKSELMIVNENAIFKEDIVKIINSGLCFATKEEAEKKRIEILKQLNLERLV